MLPIVQASPAGPSPLRVELAGQPDLTQQALVQLQHRGTGEKLIPQIEEGDHAGLPNLRPLSKLLSLACARLPSRCVVGYLHSSVVGKQQQGQRPPAAISPPLEKPHLLGEGLVGVGLRQPLHRHTPPAPGGLIHRTKPADALQETGGMDDSR